MSTVSLMLSTHHTFSAGLSVEERFLGCKKISMRNAIGFLIILFGLSQFFTSSFTALDGAARETFKTVEIAAVKSQQKILEQ